MRRQEKLLLSSLSTHDYPFKQKKENYVAAELSGSISTLSRKVVALFTIKLNEALRKSAEVDGES